MFLIFEIFRILIIFFNFQEILIFCNFQNLIFLIQGIRYFYNSSHSELDSPRAEVVVPNVRGVGTLAHMFEKSARIVEKERETGPKPPPKPLFYRDEHRDRLREIENEVNRQRPQYDYDYSAVDHSRKISPDHRHQTPPRPHNDHQYSPESTERVYQQRADPPIVQQRVEAPMDIYVKAPAEAYKDHDYELPPPVSPPQHLNQSGYQITNQEPHMIHSSIHHTIQNNQRPTHHDTVITPQAVEIQALHAAKRANSGTQTLPEPKEVQTDLGQG